MPKGDLPTTTRFADATFVGKSFDLTELDRRAEVRTECSEAATAFRDSQRTRMRDRAHRRAERDAGAVPADERASLRFDVVFFIAFSVVWAVCAKVFWYSPVNGLLETGLGRTGTDLLLRAIDVAVWLGFSAAYGRATGRRDPVSYLRLRHNAARGLAVGALVGSAFFAKDLVGVLLLEDRSPDLSGIFPVSFLTPFVEEVVFRGIVLQRAEVTQSLCDVITIFTTTTIGHTEPWVTGPRRNSRRRRWSSVTGRRVQVSRRR